MAKSMWLCNVCSTPWEKEADALDCERAHLMPEDLTITHVAFKSLAEHGFGFHKARRVPSRIHVRLSENCGDVAIYGLIQSGMKGV